VWGGISGAQHLLALLLTAGFSEERIRETTSENVADRFLVATRKGRIDVGLDADLVLIERGASHEIMADELLYRHRHSPYVGRKIDARVRRTILRGQTAFLDGKLTGMTRGQLLTPS
jgi:allantoinase